MHKEINSKQYYFHDVFGLDLFDISKHQLNIFLNLVELFILRHIERNKVLFYVKPENEQGLLRVKSIDNVEVINIVATKQDFEEEKYISLVRSWTTKNNYKLLQEMFLELQSQISQNDFLILEKMELFALYDLKHMLILKYKLGM